ncbi:MAG: lipoprotein-releasing ABC transporter permease subunit [Alphaproteobacteria bacterium]|nr:lipoprotein-releasing ABC transporter permease subunit [Alphaproteobacteria bacterium]
MSFTSQIVRRYLGARRGFTKAVTIFSVLGIALGVAALLVVLAVMSGFRAELMSRILGVSGHAQLEVAGLETAQATQLAAELRRIPGITEAMPYVTGQVLVSAGGRATGAFVRGIPTLPPAIAAGTLGATGKLTEIPTGDVLLGQGLASALGVLPGMDVTLLAPQGARTPFGFVPRAMGYPVGGTFSVGMVQIDSGLVLLGLADAQAFLRRGNGVDALELRVADPEEIEALTPAIFTAAQRYAEAPDISLTPWTVSNGEFFRALQVERVTMFIILSLIVLVAAFNIITGQMMLVNDKLADIAILRTMGATQGQIRRIFLYNGLLLGGLGTAAGTALGLVIIFNMTAVVNGIRALFGIDLFPRDVYFLSELPGRLSPLDLTAVLAMALGLTLLASLYPAWRASRFHPVELLRRG